MTLNVFRFTGLNSSLALKAPARCATTGNITLQGLFAIDGVSLQSTDTNLRVLVMNQTDPRQNGIYDAQASGWTRSADWDSNDDFVSGTRVFVVNGTTQAGITYVLNSADPIRLGTSNITFVQEASLLGAAVEFVIDGAGLPISTGLKGFIVAPFKGTISQVSLLADQTGSIVVDVFKCSYAQFDAGATHPVSGDSITAAAKPTLTTAVKYQDAVLSGWTTAIASGDILAFNVNSTSGVITRVTIVLSIALPQ